MGWVGEGIGEILLFLIMFGRFLSSMLRASMPAYKPVFTFPKQLVSVNQMVCKSLLGGMAVTPNTVQMQNLLEFLEKCEKEAESKCEINSLNQISLLFQDTQTGLTKTPVRTTL